MPLACDMGAGSESTLGLANERLSSPMRRTPNPAVSRRHVGGEIARSPPRGESPAVINHDALALTEHRLPQNCAVIYPLRTPLPHTEVGSSGTL